MDIKIRGLSPSTIAKIDELKGKKSRNKYLKEKIEELAQYPELLNLDNKYEKIVNRSNKVIEENTNILNELLD